MAKLAILGFGTVGSGVLEVLRANADSIARRAGQALEVKYILDVRDFSSSPDAALFVKDLEEILADPEIRVVVETIGGTGFAYPAVRRVLETGRSVCTSNKELVASHGAELLALARKKGCAFLFEASVGGGTPLIGPIVDSLAANRITGVAGIVNGTTNYILTRMKKEGLGMQEALREAQSLGYAETKGYADDIDGIDACRKISILASLASGREVAPQTIPTRGIADITALDIRAAERLGCAVKLIAWARLENGVQAGVEPMLVPRQSQLAGIDGVFNGITVQGDMVGEVLFYGQGAGKLATASAVAADAIRAVRDGASVHEALFWEATPGEESPPEDGRLLAAAVRTRGLAPEQLPALLGEGSLAAQEGGTCIYYAQALSAAGLQAASEKAEALGGELCLALRRLPEEMA